MLLNLGILKGPMYVYVILEIIRLSKSLLILELEKGREASIPMILCQKNYPQSFQYYDALIDIIR